MSSDIKWEQTKQCDLQSVVDRFEAIDNNDDKKSFILNVIDECAVCPTVKTTPTKRKGKRKLSGWNCYLKWCSQNTRQTFPECLQAKAMKDDLYYPHKEEWNKISGDVCELDKISLPEMKKYMR